MACAESCTGGMVASALTSIPGSSVWFECGFTCYSNQAKERILGVSNALLRDKGAVSTEVALAMVAGIFQHTPVQVAVATTGIAGPSGGSVQKPVGLVCFAWGQRKGNSPAPDSDLLMATEVQHFTGNRSSVRRAATKYAIQGLIQRLPISAEDIGIW